MQVHIYSSDIYELFNNSTNAHPVNTKHLYDFMQSWTSVGDVGPTLYKCYTKLMLLDRRTFPQTLYISPIMVRCWASVAYIGLTFKQHWVRPPCRDFSCSRYHSTPECDEAFSTYLSTPLHPTPNCRPLP